MGFVFQDFKLIPTKTVIENVSLMPHLLGETSVQQQRRMFHVLKWVGLQHRQHAYPDELSGGEQQRVAMARAFVVQPKILFADEPTGNLDAATGGQIIDLMLELNGAQGTTLILVTHDVALAQQCGRQLHLAAGRIVP